MMPYPPLGTLYIAGYLRKRGISVDLHDVMLAEDEEEILPVLDRFHPKIVALCDDGFNFLTKMCLTRMREAAFKMAGLAKSRGCRVIIASSDAADHLDKYFSHGADYVVCGEAEITLAELSEMLLGRSSQPINRIEGLAYLQDGEIVRTPRRTLVQDLDDLPFPAWDLADLDRYRGIWTKRHGYFSLNMVTTRGCPFHCNWCAKPIYGQVYHSRSPRNVVEEMTFLRRFAGPDHIWFADDIFGLKPGWIAEFDEQVRNEGIRMPFKCLSRVDLLLKEDNIRHLKSAGCHTVWVGAESGSQKVLDAMEKGTTVGQIYESTRLLHQVGIRVGFFLQYGYPGETMEDVAKTLQMLKDCRPDEIGISVSYPLPGTKFYDRVKQDLDRKQNWIDSGDLDLMFQGAYSPDFYRTLHRFTHKKFRVWQAAGILRDVLAHPARTNRSSIRRLAAAAYHAATLPQLKAELDNLAMNRASGAHE